MTKDWLQVKDRIRELYVVQAKSLTEVTRTLRDKHGFTASTRAYRIKLREWGFKRERRHSASPSEPLHTTHPILGPASSPEAARTNSPESGTPSHHIPDEVVLSLIDCILDSHIDRLELFLHGPYRFVVNNWHIDFTPIFHERQAFQEVLGKSLLSLAASDSTIEVVELILRESANVDFKDLRTRETPLMAAIRRGDCSIVRLLLEKGASMAILNSHGLHALQVAALFGKEPGIMDQLVVPHGALLNAPAAEGLHKGTTVLELLLKRRVKCASSHDHSLTNRYLRSLLGAGARFKGLERLIVLPWLEPCAHRCGIADDEFALLTSFLEAGLDLRTSISDLPDDSHMYSVSIDHVLAFHSVVPGMASFLARTIDVSTISKPAFDNMNANDGNMATRMSMEQPFTEQHYHVGNDANCRTFKHSPGQPVPQQDETNYLHILCGGCVYNHSPAIEDDTRTAIDIMLKRGVDPNRPDELDQTPLNNFLNSVAWFGIEGDHPTRLESLGLLLEHGAEPWRAAGDVHPVWQVLEELDDDEPNRAYAFDVVCLLLRHSPHGPLRGYLPVTKGHHRPRYQDSYFERVFAEHRGLSASSLKIFRLAAEHVAMETFMDEQLSFEKGCRDYDGILDVVTRQRDRWLSGGGDEEEAMLPRAFVLDVLELLVDQRKGQLRPKPFAEAIACTPSGFVALEQ